MKNLHQILTPRNREQKAQQIESERKIITSANVKIQSLEKEAIEYHKRYLNVQAYRLEKEAFSLREALRRAETKEDYGRLEKLMSQYSRQNSRPVRRQFKEGDKTGDQCYYCNADRVWIKDTRRESGWMRSCPNFPTCRKPRQNSNVDEAKLKRLVEQQVSLAVAKLEDSSIKEIVWKVNDVELAKLERRAHMALTPILSRIKAGLNNILLVGPAGSGKTTLCADLAESMKMKFASASCSGGMPEWHLTGRSLPDLTTGLSRFQSSEFVRLYEEGGVFLLDEMDAADPNVMVIINSAIANGYLNIPARTEKPQAKRHKDFYLVCAANTFGTGGNMQYQGRNALDAATLDRFVGAIIVVDYDRKLEERLVPEADILLRVWGIRDKVEQLKMRRIVGTRSLLAAAALNRSGESLRDSIQALMVGWTDDEKTKVGEVWH